MGINCTKPFKNSIPHHSYKGKQKVMTGGRTDRKCMFFWWAEHLLSQLTRIGISREQTPGLTSITGLHPKTWKGKGEDAGVDSTGSYRWPAPWPEDGRGTPSCPRTLCAGGTVGDQWWPPDLDCWKKGLGHTGHLSSPERFLHAQ